MSLLEFIHDTTLADIPPAVATTARDCILDLLGVAAAGSRTPLAAIASNFAVRHLSPGAGERHASLLFDGRQSGVIGAAYAGAATIDSFDAHDGHALTKGHAGVVVLPAVLSTAWDSDDRELLACVVVGYEIALRSGIALHATASDYHTSGAWNSVAVAALGARRLGLPGPVTRQALGIAEFHGPRSPMMRCIDHPTMVKDGSAWGALAGLSAAYLAQDGFTGAPAQLTEGDAVSDLWDDLGVRWRITEQYLKPFPVCRWAQPAIQAALDLQRQFAFRPCDITEITVTTFTEATRLAAGVPGTTEEAQYALAFPLAAAVVRGGLGASEVSPGSFVDPEIVRICRCVVTQVSTAYDSAFPAQRWADVTVRLADGRILSSLPTAAPGDPERPLSAESLVGKFRSLSVPVVGERRAARIEAAVRRLGGSGGDLGSLLDDVLTRTEPVDPVAAPVPAERG